MHFVFMKSICRVMIFIVTVCNSRFSLAGHRVNMFHTLDLANKQYLYVYNSNN